VSSTRVERRNKTK